MSWPLGSLTESLALDAIWNGCTTGSSVNEGSPGVNTSIWVELNGTIEVLQEAACIGSPVTTPSRAK